jgi:hypothetical protein
VKKEKVKKDGPEISEEQFLKALTELKGKGGSDAIRSKLGIAPSQAFNGKLRKVAKSLEAAGKIKVSTIEGKRTWVYEVC